MYVRPRPRFRPRNAGGVPFSPALLFTGGVAGAWYDPSDVLLNWRTNLLTWSQEFDNAAWTKVNVTAANTSSTTAPDGTTTADTITGDGTNAVHEVRQVITTTGSAIHAISVYLKQNTERYAYVLPLGRTVTDDNGDVVYVDLQTGTILSSSGSGTSATLSSVGSGWYRLVIPTSAYPASSQIEVRMGVANVASAQSSTASGSIYIWGAQLELGSTATTYQAITTPEQTYLLYDPQPVLYQDSAGTTPVTAVEQPVGLMLDKSQGLVLGSELVTNGDFSGGTTGWTAGNSATLSTTGGKLSVVNGAVSLGQGRQTITTVAGKTYKLSVTFTSVSASRGYVFVGTFAGDNSRFSAGPLTTSQTVTGYFTAAGTSTYLSIGNADNSIGLEVQFDDVTVKDIAGNHARAPNDPSRPMLRARYNLLTYSEQFDNAAWNKLSAGTGAVPVVTANYAAAPDGTTTADRVVFDRGAGTTASDISYLNQSITSISADCTGSIWIRTTDGSTKVISFRVGNTFNYTTSVTGTWTRFTLTGTSPVARLDLLAYGDRSVQVTDLLVWGADLRTGSSAGTYQRIAAATDYATAGFAPYLAFDGVDDFLGAAYVQNAYPLTIAAGINTDASVSGSVGIVSVAQSDTQYKVLRDMSANGTDANDRNAGNPETADIIVSGSKFALSQFETSLITHQVNGGTATTAANTNAFGTSANIFVGKVRPAGLFSSAKDYGVVITNTVLTAAEKDSLKNWMAGRMGVTL